MKMLQEKTLQTDPQLRATAAQLIVDLSEQNYNSHEEVQHVFMQMLMNRFEVVMVDMPQVLLRMKIAENHTLNELVEIFNAVLLLIHGKKGPS